VGDNNSKMNGFSFFAIIKIKNRGLGNNSVSLLFLKAFCSFWLKVFEYGRLSVLMHEKRSARFSFFAFLFEDEMK